MSAQPQYRLIANLGDQGAPLIHGGYFVYVDDSGVYPPRAEWVECPPDGIDVHDKDARWTVYQFDLEPCTYQDGVLGDNPYHPDHAAWFADSLDTFADSFGMTPEEFAGKFTSSDPTDRAFAWREVGEFHGFQNLDHDPLELTRREIDERYPDHAIRKPFDRVAADGNTFTVNEYTSGYEIEHIPSGQTHWLSDGVDVEPVEYDSDGKPITGPGTDGFCERWAQSFNSDVEQTLEAYFPDIYETDD